MQRRPRYKTRFQGKTKASILRSDRDGWIKLTTPYLGDFVEELKEIIAPSHRQWVATDKFWLISENYLEEAIQLVQRYFDEVTTDLIEAKDSPTNGPYSVLFLVTGAPTELVKSAYRLLSMASHPDKSGTDEQMSKLNKAYEEIRKERGF